MMYRNVHVNKQVTGGSKRKKGTNAAVAAGIVQVWPAAMRCVWLCTFELCPVPHVRIFSRHAASHKACWR